MGLLIDRFGDSGNALLLFWIQLGAGDHAKLAVAYDTFPRRYALCDDGLGAFGTVYDYVA
jgi:hypothetical protein